MSTTLDAQSTCPCCAEVNSQFDFWLGEWNVLDPQGKKVGENRIEKIEEGCGVLEHWKGATGGTGTSLNYYDRSDSTWNQVWIDNSGNILTLKGGFGSGGMVLKSPLKKGADDTWYYDRITWYANEDGTVTQEWGTYDKKDELIKSVFHGVYQRKE